MARLLPILSTGALLAGLGCGSTLLSQRVEGKAEGWSLTVREMQDGPDRISTGGADLTCGGDERFLHVWITLKNETDQERKWNWPRCALDHGSDAYLPTIIMYDMVLRAEASHVEELDAGEEIERHVIFTYPEADPLPTRLKCGDILIPLVLAQ